MDDDQIIERGGDEGDIARYAEENGANLTKEDVERGLAGVKRKVHVGILRRVTDLVNVRFKHDLRSGCYCGSADGPHVEPCPSPEDCPCDLPEIEWECEPCAFARAKRELWEAIAEGMRLEAICDWITKIAKRMGL